MQERQVQSLSWEDPLEEEMETHSSILAWKIPWTEEPGGLNPRGRTGLDWSTDYAHIPIVMMQFYIYNIETKVYVYVLYNLGFCS